MIRFANYSTNGPRADGQVSRPMDLDDDGAFHFMAPCQDMLNATAQVRIVKGTGSAFVLTVVVSNDPKGVYYENHPSAITLTNSTKITALYSVAGYLWHGVKLTTVNDGDCLADIFLVAKDSPA